MSLPVFETMGLPLNAIQRLALIEFHEYVYTGKIQIQQVDTCFCGSSQFQLLSRCDRFGLPFGTKICTSCGLISQTVQLHQSSMPLFYERIYWPLVIGTNASELSQDVFLTQPKQDEASSYILRCLDSSKKKLRIFEVGCGSGIRIKRLKDELEQLGHQVQAFGCDYSSDALLQAKRNEIEVVQGGFDEIGQFGSADILILSHVFEHFPDLNLALEQINTLIHDSSLIYIEVPGVDDLVNKAEYGFNYQVYCVLAHTYNFSLRSLTAVMSSGGFRLLEGDEYVRSIFVKGEAQKELNSAYETTIYALEKAYKKSDVLYTKRNNPVYLYLKNVAKAILGRNPS
jgi:SAM-dependent methyltransferase